MKEVIPSEHLLREGGVGVGPLHVSKTETLSKVVFPVFRSTIIGAHERGHAKQRDGVEDPGWRRACRGVCCKTIRVIFLLLITSHNINDLSAADTRIWWPYFDQQMLVMGEEHSSSRRILAMPLVSKSQITQLPLLHPAGSIEQLKIKSKKIDIANNYNK